MAMKGDCIVLGMSKMGNPVGIDVRKAPRMAICGSSGSGKSVLLNNILTQYMRKLRGDVFITALDPKVTSLAHLEPRLDVYENEPSNFLGRIQDFETVMAQRYAEMRRMGVASIGSDDLGRFPLHLLVIEEAMSVVQNEEVSKDAAKKIMALYTTILTRCRAANMGVIMVSHSFSAECLPTVARDQLGTRVLMQTSSSAVVSMLADPDEAPAHLIRNPGEFYFIEGAGASPVRSKTWLMTEDEAGAIAVEHSRDKHDGENAWVVANPEQTRGSRGLAP